MIDHEQFFPSRTEPIESRSDDAGAWLPVRGLWRSQTRPVQFSQDWSTTATADAKSSASYSARRAIQTSDEIPWALPSQRLRHPWSRRQPGPCVAIYVT
jgi:hypothetical protein